MHIRHIPFAPARLILLLLWASSAFAPGLFAQPTNGGEEVVLALQIIDSRTGQFIPGLKVYLVDERHVHYLEKHEHFDDSEKKFRYSYDTLVFWQNLKTKWPSGAHLGSKHRISYEGLEESYVIALNPLAIDKYRLDQLPVYMAKVVDIDGEKNGGKFPTRFYRLDYRDAVSTLQRGVFEPKPRSSYHFSFSTIAGNRYMPTVIHLDQSALPNPKFNPTVDMYRPVYDTLRKSNGQDSLYGLRYVTIRNWYSLQTIAEIIPSHHLYLGETGAQKLLEFGDYLDRNPEGKQDFKIWVKRVKNQLDQFEDYYDVFCYDEASNSYSRVPQLSDFPNIQFLSTAEPIQRIARGLEEGRIYERYYVLSNKEWVLINEVFHIPTPPPTVKQPQSACVQWLDQRSHLAKVLFHTNAEGSVEVKHRFTYINICSGPYRPLPMRSSHDPYFTATKSVASGDTGWVQFKATIAAHTTGLQPLTHMAYVPTTDNPHISVDIEFFVAHNEWVREWHANGTPSLVMVNRSDGLANALVLDEEGYPLEYGTYNTRDAQKIGNWVRYNRGGEKSYIRYGCIVHLNTVWPSDLKEEIVVWVHRNGRWILQAVSEHNGDRKIHVYEQIDSIKVKAGQGVFRQPIDYNQLANENWIHVQLIYPDQFPFPMGNTAIGATLLPDTYGIEWNRIYLSNHPPFAAYKEQEIAQLLLRRHPFIALEDGHCQYCTMISLSHLSNPMRIEVMDQLLRDSLVLHINQALQINRGAITYITGGASMRVNYNLSYPVVQAKIESYHLAYQGQVYGAGGLYSVDWPHKIRGWDFIQALQLAAKDKDITHVNPSLYYEATIDKHMRD